MVDLEKAERFLSRFTAWQSAEVAKRDKKYIDTALKISAFVDDASLETIQRDLVHGSTVYRTLREPEHKLTYGALLFGKLAVEEYYLKCVETHSFGEGEQAVLDSIAENLASLYTTPRDQPFIKFSQIINSTNRWLDTCVVGHANSALTKTTLLALYSMLKIIDIKLARLDYKEQGFLMALSINRHEVKKTIHALLEKTAISLRALEPMLPAPVVAAAAPNVPPPPVPGIETYIDAQCLSIIESEGRSLPEKMDLVGRRLDSIHIEMSAFIAEKNARDAVQAQLDHALIISLALETNEQSTIGRYYILPLININRASYNDLIAHSALEVQAEWAGRLNQLISPDLPRLAIDTVEYALSTLMFLPIAAYRAYAAPSVKSRVEAYAPVTYDSECKDRLKTLAYERLHTLRADLATSEARLAEIADRLAGTNLPFKQKILDATTLRLEELLPATLAVRRVIADYGRLCTRVIQNQIHLQTVHSLNRRVDSFIAEHNGFFVKLSLFLATISSLFKTDTAAKVEQVQAIKSQLRGLEEHYTRTITDGTDSITKDPTIEKPIKDAVLARLKPGVPTGDDVHSIHRRDVVTAYRLIDTLFNRVKLSPAVPAARPPVVAVETDGAAPLTPH